MMKGSKLGKTRKASVKDSKLLGMFLTSVSEDFPIPLDSKVDPLVYSARLIERGVVFISLSDVGDIDGCVGGYANDSKHAIAVITVVAVSRESRGTGVADGLINLFERSAREEGMRRIILDVHMKNFPAIRLYERNGFKRGGIAAHDWDIRMEKRILGLTSERPNLLITSVGRRAYLVEWFRQAMTDVGEVHVINSIAQTPAFRTADKSTVCPEIYDTEYIPFLLRYCEENGIGALITLFDVDVPVLAANAPELRKIGTLPVVPSEEIAEVCNDKLESERWLASIGVQSTCSCASIDKAKSKIKLGEFMFPLMIKPRWGMGSLGVEEAIDLDELEALYRVVRRKVCETYLRFEASSSLDESVLIEQILDGEEYGMDIMNDLDGRLRGIVLRKKLSMRSGETDVAQVVKVPYGVRCVAETISRNSRHPGNMDVDLFITGDGTVSVLEMNARFGGGYPFGHVAGVNLPKALVNWLSGNEAYSEELTPKYYGTYCKDISVVPIDNLNG